MALPEVEDELNSFSAAGLTDFTPMPAESCPEISLGLRSEADRLTSLSRLDGGVGKRKIGFESAA